ncbi:MAG: hypothetical protein B6D53_00375 [Candidatus Omnitrophica bacterium 4484_49]|nr:MAG: hypothetical protein B6D53_00375 [Candidatus Omnitrophica bacterium 4484_49]
MESIVLIPAYNEEKNIASTIGELNSNLQVSEIVVIDDGSEDRTADIAREMGAKVIRLDKNCGKGSALRKGFDYALNTSARLIFTMDADGQHRACDILKLYTHYIKFRSHIVVGNRMNNPLNMPIIRRFTNRVMSRVISIMAGIKIPDSQCGLKLISRDVLENINITSRKFEVESELLLQAARKGYRIDFVDISSVYFPGRKSKIRPVRDTIRFVKFAVKYFLRYGF